MKDDTKRALSCYGLCAYLIAYGAYWGYRLGHRKEIALLKEKLNSEEAKRADAEDMLKHLETISGVTLEDPSPIFVFFKEKNGFRRYPNMTWKDAKIAISQVIDVENRGMTLFEVTVGNLREIYYHLEGYTEEIAKYRMTLNDPTKGTLWIDMPQIENILKKEPKT